MTPTPSPGPPSLAAAMPDWERWVGWLLLAAFFVAGLNHVHAKTIFGQDFYLHMKGTENMLADPGRWFPQDFTNRPMIYVLGVFGNWLTHGNASYYVAGTICVLMNTLALWFVHASTRRFIASPWLRLAVVSFIAFLPSTEVASVVYAGDAVAQLPFALAVWALILCFESVPLRACLGYAVLAGAALVWGNFSRFPFIALPLAVLVAVILAWRCRRLSWQRSLLVVALTCIAPVYAGLWINHRADVQLANDPKHHSFHREGAGDMTWSDLLIVKPTDSRIFDAPGYWDNEVINGALHYGLPYHENYSYPALCLLTVYTDVLDYANDGQLDNGVPRPEPQKTLSQWSVRLGLITAMGIVLSVLLFVGRSAAMLVKPRFAPSNGAIIWGMMGLAWYLPLVLSFPYLENVYDWGYWLSRLIIPAIWAFSLLFFSELDRRLAGRTRWIPVVIAVLIFAQSALHFRSVWYWI
jgi:hypothetical protein